MYNHLMIFMVGVSTFFLGGIAADAVVPPHTTIQERFVDPQRTVFELMEKNCEMNEWRAMPKEWIKHGVEVMNECFDRNVPEI